MQSTAGSLQSLCWGSSAIGGIISAYFSGSLVQQYGVRPVFGITALFPLIVSVSALLIAEQPTRGAGYQPLSSSEPADGSNSPSDSKEYKAFDLASPGLMRPAGQQGLLVQLRSQGSMLWGAISKRSILYPTIFCFLWNATPSSETAMFYFQTNQLHFTPEFLGQVRLAGSLASLAGVGGTWAPLLSGETFWVGSVLLAGA